MSYAGSGPPVGPPQYQYLPGSDAIGIWPTSSMNGYEQHGNEQYDSPSQFEQDQHPQKRARSFEDINNNSGQPTNSRMPMPNNVPVNKGTANIFFKTRMCAKFKSGTCRNGESCNFAHGQQDLRQPPHNWQELVRGEEERPVGNYEDDQRIIHKMKLCKKFYNGEECPYGDRCNFVHEDPSKFREDVGRFRESAAISIGITGWQPMGHGSSGSIVADLNRPINNAAGLDASRANIKPVYWKTKLCTKWEITGHCPFGNKCHFAHGPAELQVPGGQSEVEVGNAGSTLTKQQPSVLLANNTSPIQSVNVPAVSAEEGQSKKWLLKLKDPKKLNKIYADWPDDLPLF